MKKLSSNTILCVLLVIVSLALYTLQLLIFRDSHDTAFYFLQDIAFLPLQVAIVTIVLGRILSAREKREKLRKIHMAISAFFSEAGTELMVRFAVCMTSFEEMQKNLNINANWKNSDYLNAQKYITNSSIPVIWEDANMALLKSLLLEKRAFMLRMLENPNLLEHDEFTDMLLAVFHMTEELIARDTITNLPTTDINHLKGDIQRATKHLLLQWILHMNYLKSDYPYLYSLEVRKSPFRSESGVVIYH